MWFNVILPSLLIYIALTVTICAGSLIGQESDIGAMLFTIITVLFSSIWCILLMIKIQQWLRLAYSQLKRRVNHNIVGSWVRFRS